VSVTELMPLMNFLVHSYTYCSDRHASSYWTFIRRWISMGFTRSLLKKRTTERCSSLMHVSRGPPFLHYYCAVVLHSCIVPPPVGHSSNYEYHCCPLTRQSSCVSNYYRTFKVSIWLSLLYEYIHTKLSEEPVLEIHSATLNVSAVLLPKMTIDLYQCTRRHIAE
jgi:hypothetical protein